MLFKKIKSAVFVLPCIHAMHYMHYYEFVVIQTNLRLSMLNPVNFVIL